MAGGDDSEVPPSADDSPAHAELDQDGVGDLSVQRADGKPALSNQVSAADDSSVRSSSTLNRDEVNRKPDQKAHPVKAVDYGYSGGPREERGWGLVGVLSGVAAAVIGLVALLVAIFAWLGPRAAPPSASDLKVVSVDLAQLREVQFAPDFNSDLPEDARAEGYTVQDSVVDVQLFNSGGSPVLITEIEAKFVYAELLIACPPAGGALGITGLYDVRVPTDINVPRVVTVQKPFQVAPNSYDRFAITLGPDASTRSWIYTVELSAKTFDSAESISLGTVTLISPIAALGEIRAQPQSTDPVQAPCSDTNRQALNEAIQFNTIISPEVKDLRDRFNAGSAGRVAPTLEICNQAGLATELLREDHGDLTNDGVHETILTQSCSGPTSSWPSVVQVFDNRGPVGGSHPIGKLLTEQDGLDKRGLRVQGVHVANGILMIYSAAYRAGDVNDRPSVYVTDEFTWNGTEIAPVGQRQCVDSKGQETVCVP